VPKTSLYALPVLELAVFFALGGCIVYRLCLGVVIVNWFAFLAVFVLAAWAGGDGAGHRLFGQTYNSRRLVGVLALVLRRAWWVFHFLGYVYSRSFGCGHLGREGGAGVLAVRLASLVL